MLCMHLPFIPKAEALELLEDADREIEARGEYLAEQGSSYFYGGMSASDAAWLAEQDDYERAYEFRQTEEGQLYYARLDAARLYDTLGGLELGEWSIPEFVDGKTSYSHSPFFPSSSRFDRPADSDDIPF